LEEETMGVVIWKIMAIVLAIALGVMVLRTYHKAKRQVEFLKDRLLELENAELHDMEERMEYIRGHLDAHQGVFQFSGSPPREY